MRKALCLKTKLFLFESDENLQNKENGFYLSRMGAVPDKASDEYLAKEDDKKDDEFEIGCAPEPFEPNKLNAILGVRRSLIREFDALAGVYLDKEDADKYKQFSIDHCISEYAARDKNGLQKPMNMIIGKPSKEFTK